MEILFVDDESDVRQAMGDVIISAGFNVTTSNDGKKAFEIYRSGYIDMIITDLVMPGGGGLEFIEKVRGINRDIPIAVLSGMGGFDDVVKALNLGANYYIQKPCEAGVIIHYINEARNKNKMVNENLRYRQKLDETLAGKQAEIERATEQLKKAHQLAKGAIDELRERIKQLMEINGENIIIARKFQTLFEKSPLGILTIDSKFVIADCNRQFLTAMGFSSAEEVRRLDILTYPPFINSNLSESLLLHNEDMEFEHDYELPDGRKIIMRFNVVRLGRKDYSCETIVFIEDVTLKAMARKEMEQLARYDKLTGVLSKNYFEGELAKAIQDAENNNSSLVLVTIDVDYFKDVNDNYGHQIGDRFLEIVGDRMRGSAKENDLFFRTGGDEFAWTIKNSKASDQEKILKRMFNRLSEIYRFSDLPHPHKNTFSMGVTVFTEGKSIKRLVEESDIAVYNAKLKRNCIVYFNEGMKMPPKKNNQIEKE